MAVEMGTGIAERALSVRDVRAGYGAATVVRGVDFELAAGDLVCVIGPNGAGKTTLLRAIAGSIRIQSGQVVFGERDVTYLSRRDRAKLGIGFVPDSDLALGNMTIVENLKVAAEAVGGRLTPDDLDAVYAIFPGLVGRGKQESITLSGGELRMLAIARVLVTGASLLIIDEPSSGLSVGAVRALANALQEIRDKRGASIVMAEQNVGLVRDLQAQTVLVERGEVTWRGSSTELLSTGSVVTGLVGGRASQRGR